VAPSLIFSIACFKVGFLGTFSTAVDGWMIEVGCNLRQMET
jgi:hypothetical protein